MLPRLLDLPPIWDLRAPPKHMRRSILVESKLTWILIKRHEHENEVKIMYGLAAIAVMASVTLHGFALLRKVTARRSEDGDLSRVSEDSYSTDKLASTV